MELTVLQLVLCGELVAVWLCFCITWILLAQWVKMSDEDIVILLSNLLNNAIEASENTEEKIVKFKFAIEDGKIILSVKNTYDRKPNEVSGELLTTKLDKMEEQMKK